MGGTALRPEDLADAIDELSARFPSSGLDPQWDPVSKTFRVAPAPAETVSKIARWLLNRGKETAAKASLVADATGMVLLPPAFALEILEQSGRTSVIRSLCQPRPTNQVKSRVGLLDPVATNWGRAETGTTPADGDVQPVSPIDEVETHDLNSLVKIGVDELEDAGEALRLNLVEVFGAAVAKAEDVVFGNGSGSGQPRGIGNATNVGRVPAGQKTTAAATNTPTLADLQGLPWKLPDEWRPSASWLIHPTAAAKVQALTYTNGSPLWPNPGNPDPKTGGGLLGWPAYITAGLPDPATAGVTDASVVFGDIGAAYRIYDRAQMGLVNLRERYAELGQVGALLRHRTGGDLVRPGALALYLL